MRSCTGEGWQTGKEEREDKRRGVPAVSRVGSRAARCLGAGAPPFPLFFGGLQFRASCTPAVPSVAWCLHPHSLVHACDKAPFGRWDERRGLING